MGRPLALALGLAVLGAAGAAPWLATAAVLAAEPPELAARVDQGALPPLAARLPEHPLVVPTDPGAEYGGVLRTLIGTPKDLKLAFVYGYARLVRYDRQYRVVPDIVERYEVTEGRIFTFHLRKGHRWWPRWGLYFESKGRQGEPPSLPAARRLVELYERWLATADPAEQRRIWGQMLDINAEEVFTIGILGGALQPVVVKNGLQGVPEKGIYAWDPGAHFGLYSPDTFYWRGGHRS